MISMNEILIAETSFRSWVLNGELYVRTKKSCCRVKEVLRHQIGVDIRLVLPTDNLIVQGTIVAIEMKTMIGTKVVIEGTLEDSGSVCIDAKDRKTSIGIISTGPLDTFSILAR